MRLATVQLKDSIEKNNSGFHLFRFKWKQPKKNPLKKPWPEPSQGRSNGEAKERPKDG
jgi:hypothetical protein